MKDAVDFPTMAASSLTARVEVEFPQRLKERVTMVCLFHKQFGYSMTSSWVQPFEEAFGVSGESEECSWNIHYTNAMLMVA